MAWMSGWTKRWIVPIDHTKVGSGGVTNFPAYLSGAVIPAEVLSACAFEDCRDLRVTLDDGVTVLNLENVLFSRSGFTGEGHYNHPSISSAVDTTVCVYAGNAGVGKMSTAEQQAVWTNEAALWHMSEPSWAGVPGEVINSTALNVSGQATGSAAAEAGIISNAGSFPNAGSPNVTVPNANLLGGGAAITISFWQRVFADATTYDVQYTTVFSNDGGTQGYWFGARYKHTSYRFRYEFYRRTPLVELLFDWVTLSAGWHYVAVVANATATTLYVDGVSRQDQTGIVPLIPRGSGNAYFGSPWIVAGSEWRFDELRVANAAKSTADILTSYNNQFSPSTFYGAGTVESAPSGRMRRWNPFIMPGSNPGFMLFPGGL